MNRIERIAEMEGKLNAANAALTAYADALKGYRAAQDAIEALSEYYGSDDWRADFEADERGELPKDLRRGVLSEDGIYDALTENRALFVRTLEVLAEIERER